MQTASRWLNWQPQNARTPHLTPDRTDKTDETPSLTPATEGFVSFVNMSGTPSCASTAPVQDHSFWTDDFGKWALAECTFSDRWFTAVKALHGGFCDWCLAQGTVGCMVETFEALLESEGFLIAGGLVSGLTLKADVEALTSSNGCKAAKR